jgi:hypothetical protein
MSQYKFINADNHEVMYGLDRPTGGYFFTEFFTDEEMNAKPKGSDNVCLAKDALTLTELIIYLDFVYQHEVDEKHGRQLLLDYRNSLDPSPLQVNTQKMFGVDLEVCLKRVKEDIRDYITVEL